MHPGLAIGVPGAIIAQPGHVQPADAAIMATPPREAAIAAAAGPQASPPGMTAFQSLRDPAINRRDAEKDVMHVQTKLTESSANFPACMRAMQMHDRKHVSKSAIMLC